MNSSISPQKILVFLGVPLLMLLGLSLLATSNIFFTFPANFSFGITFDFLITVPLVYFLLIRKTSIPKFTVFIFFLAGLLMASFTIPVDHQNFLTFGKKWLLPVLEIFVLITILTKLFLQLAKLKKVKSSIDFYTLVRTSSGNLFPGKLNIFFATELAVFYYGFIKWKVRKPKSHEFTYHRNSGILLILMAFVFLILIETFILHLLIARWCETIAWILTAISTYTVIQIFGFLKSITQRYSFIENGILNLRYGILCEASIDIAKIKDLEFSSSDIPAGSLIKKFSPFGNLESHNVIIKLLEKENMTRPYGFEDNFQELAVFIDDIEKFKAQIEEYQSNTY